MIRRSTWILLAVFAVALAFTIYLARTPQGVNRLGDPTETPAETSTLLDKWPVETLIKIEIHYPNATPVVIQRNPDNSWGFITVDQRKLDQGKFTQLVSALPALSITTRLASAPPVENTGLSDKAVVLTLSHSDGSKWVVRFGNKTPTQSGYYVQLNDQVPVIVSLNGTDELWNLFQPDGMVLQTPTPTVADSPAGVPVDPATPDIKITPAPIITPSP